MRYLRIADNSMSNKYLNMMSKPSSNKSLNRFYLKDLIHASYLYFNIKRKTNLRIALINKWPFDIALFLPAPYFWRFTVILDCFYDEIYSRNLRTWIVDISLYHCTIYGYGLAIYSIFMVIWCILYWNFNHVIVTIIEPFLRGDFICPSSKIYELMCDSVVLPILDSIGTVKLKTEGYQERKISLLYLMKSLNLYRNTDSNLMVHADEPSHDESHNSMTEDNKRKSKIKKYRKKTNNNANHKNNKNTYKPAESSHFKHLTLEADKNRFFRERSTCLKRKAKTFKMERTAGQITCTKTMSQSNAIQNKHFSEQITELDTKDIDELSIPSKTTSTHLLPVRKSPSCAFTTKVTTSTDDNLSNLSG